MSNCITRLRWTVELYRQLNCAYYENNNILFACYYFPNCFILLHTTKYTFLFRICRKTFYISLLDNLQYHLYLVLFTAYIIIKLLLVPTNMAKHIIMLTLCFMAYIIGNVNAKDDASRKGEFELAVKCYEQMFENGLIKGIPDLQKSETDTFQTVLTNFYTAYQVETVKNENGDIIPTLNNHQFNTDRALDSFRREFIHDFIQKGTDDVLKGHITTLTAKMSRGELNDYPLRVFVLKYEPTSHTEYLRSTSAFCRKFSECPSFENALNEAVRKEKFELAVKCYEQMFENGIIKGIPDLQKSETDTFKTVLTNFYTAYQVETVKNDNGDIIPTLNNHQFNTDRALDSLRREFINDFIKKDTEEIFKGHITALKAKFSKGELNDYPLRVFVLKYEPTSNTGYLRSTSAFCRKYSECPKFDNANDDASRKAEFELAVKCYEQMFENGIIKGIPDLQKSETDTFKTVLTNFYTAYQVETVKNDNGDIIPTLNNHQFKTYEELDSFRREFTNDFLQKGSDDILKGHISALTAKMSKGELNDYPLKEFVLKYEPTSNTDYLRSTSAFCRKYSECPSFEN